MRAVESDGYTFYFLYDRNRADELHISRRIGIDVEIAIDTFFDGTHNEDSRHRRFECYTETHGVYWTWLHGDATSTNVLMISCFRQEGG